MRLQLLCCSLAILPPTPLQGQTRPLVDHHQHLGSPATIALLSPAPLPAIDLPPELNTLLQARSRSAQDTSVLRTLYTDDAWLVQSSRSNWLAGRESVVGSVARSSRPSSYFVPVGSSVLDSAGHVTAYLMTGRSDSARRAAHVLFAVRRGPDGRWRIAAEAHAASGPSIDPISARDLVALLDSAGIRRAAVLSMAYTWGRPGRNLEDEYAKVRAENDWTSRQVAGFADRLRGLCSFNPLRTYALEELARCANDPHLRHGLKLHFGNSAVDLRDAGHLEPLRSVFRSANDHRMPIIVHMRASVSRGMAYGRAEATIFLQELLPAAPDVPVQIAHLAGAGGYDDPTDDALAVFAEAVARQDPRTARLWFDVSGIVIPFLDFPADRAELVATRLRQLGLERILYGSDAATGGNLAPRQAWVVFRQLPLSDAELGTIAGNVAPWMR